MGNSNNYYDDSQTHSSFDAETVFGARNQKNEYIAIKQKINFNDANLLHKSSNLFHNELKALSCLEHPNIVKFIGCEYKDNTIHGIVMENINGILLEKFIIEQQRLGETKIKQYLVQLVDAVAYMHSKFYIHRDIKSSNIMIIRKKVLKLIDFGAVRQLNKNSQIIGTDDLSLGTLPYMAPETGMQGYGSTVDIWSIGAVLFEMATGDVHVHNNGVSMMLVELSGIVETANLSEIGNSFLQLCLLRNPLQRPQAVQLLQHEFIRHQ